MNDDSMKLGLIFLIHISCFSIAVAFLRFKLPPKCKYAPSGSATRKQGKGLNENANNYDLTNWNETSADLSLGMIDQISYPTVPSRQALFGIYRAENSELETAVPYPIDRLIETTVETSNEEEVEEVEKLRFILNVEESEETGQVTLTGTPTQSQDNPLQDRPIQLDSSLLLALEGTEAREDNDSITYTVSLDDIGPLQGFIKAPTQSTYTGEEESLYDEVQATPKKKGNHFLLIAKGMAKSCLTADPWEVPVESLFTILYMVIATPIIIYIDRLAVWTRDMIHGAYKLLKWCLTCRGWVVKDQHLLLALSGLGLLIAFVVWDRLEQNESLFWVTDYGKGWYRWKRRMKRFLHHKPQRSWKTL